MTKRPAAVFLFLFFSLNVSTSGHADTNAGLKTLAAERNIRIGAAVAPYYFSEPEYADVLTNEFNLVTPENQLKWSVLRPEEGKFDFSSADSVLAFAGSNGMEVRGHALVWHFMNPEWLDRTKWSRTELTNLLFQHIYRVVSRYKGIIREWDVVNEPLNDGGSFRRSVWMDVIGPDYIELAFRWAHQADPEAALYLNEYDAEWNTVKSLALYELVRSLLRKKVPVHGVGFQCHWELGKIPKTSVLKKNLKRFADLGLKVEITEADVRFRDEPTERKLQEQARAYETMLRAAMETGNFQAFVLWGISDKYSWVPFFFQDYGNALVFDGEYGKKPAYFALRKVLAGPVSNAGLHKK